MNSREKSAGGNDRPVGARFPRTATQPYVPPVEREGGAPRDSAGRASFDLVVRGYDRRQVDEHVAATQDEIKGLRRDLDRALGRAAELTSQLDALRQRLGADSSATRSGPDAGDPHSYPPGPLADKLVRLARREAALVRANATREAADIVDAARAQAEAYRLRAEQADGGSTRPGDRQVPPTAPERERVLPGTD